LDTRGPENSALMYDELLDRFLCDTASTAVQQAMSDVPAAGMPTIRAANRCPRVAVSSSGSKQKDGGPKSSDRQRSARATAGLRAQWQSMKAPSICGAGSNSDCWECADHATSEAASYPRTAATSRAPSRSTTELKAYLDRLEAEVRQHTRSVLLQFQCLHW
jgi:hypothetical protein